VCVPPLGKTCPREADLSQFRPITVKLVRGVLVNLAPSATVIDHAAFDRLVMSELPEVAAELDSDDRALLHMEMAAVARATSRAIQAGDLPATAQHFTLMEEVLARADGAVENAVYVSYLENVFLGDERPAFLAARGRLPPRLAKGLVELEEHWEKLARHAKDT
jgi:hypothetical protein